VGIELEHSKAVERGANFPAPLIPKKRERKKREGELLQAKAGEGDKRSINMTTHALH